VCSKRETDLSRLYKNYIPNVGSHAHYETYAANNEVVLGTINRELAALSHLFTKAVEWKWLTARPDRIKRFPEDHGRIVYLTVEQVRSLLEAAKSDQNRQVYPFIRIGLDTSMRLMEILSTRRDDVDVERRIIFVPRAKAGARKADDPRTGGVLERVHEHSPGRNTMVVSVVRIKTIKGRTHSRHHNSVSTRRP